MEIIIGLVLVAGLAYYLLRRNKALEDATEAPYKVEAPAVDWELPKVNEVESKPQEPVVQPAAKPAKAPKKPKVVKGEQSAKPKATKAAKPKAPAMKVVKGDAPAKKTAKPKKTGK